MAKPTTVSWTVQDNDNEFSTQRFNIHSSVNTIANIETAAQAILEKAQACITGTIVEVQVSIPLDISGWTLTPSDDGDDTDKKVGARSVWRTPENFKAEFNLPTFDLTKVNSPGSDVDLADGDILAFDVAVLANHVSTNQNVEVEALVKFYETYGGKR